MWQPCVADPGCLFRIPDPDFSHHGSQIQGQKDSGSRNTVTKYAVVRYRITPKYGTVLRRNTVPYPFSLFLGYCIPVLRICVQGILKIRRKGLGTVPSKFLE